MCSPCPHAQDARRAAHRCLTRLVTCARRAARRRARCRRPSRTVREQHDDRHSNRPPSSTCSTTCSTPTPPPSARLVLVATMRHRLHNTAPAPATITARAQSTGRPSAPPSPLPLHAYKRVLGIALAPTTPAATTTIAAASRWLSRSCLLAPPQPEPRWGIEPPHSPLPFPLLPGLPSAPRAAGPRPPPCASPVLQVGR